MPIERGECHVLLRRRREIITVGLNSSFSYPTSSMLSCRRVLINLLASTTLEIHSPGGGEEEIMFHPLEHREKRREGGTIDGVHSAQLLPAPRAFFLPFEPVAPHQKCLSSSPLRDEARERGSLTLDNSFGGDILSGTPPFSHTKCDTEWRLSRNLGSNPPDGRPGELEHLIASAVFFSIIRSPDRANPITQ